MKFLVGLVAVAVIVGSIFLLANGNQPAANTTQANTLASGTLILDVRTPEEYNSAHVASAALFPVTDLQAGKFPKVSKDSPIAVYCRSGNRSKVATLALKQAGFTNVTDIGGLDDLKKFGLSAL